MTFGALMIGVMIGFFLGLWISETSPTYFLLGMKDSHRIIVGYDGRVRQRMTTVGEIRRWLATLDATEPPEATR